MHSVRLVPEHDAESFFRTTPNRRSRRRRGGSRSSTLRETSEPRKDSLNMVASAQKKWFALALLCAVQFMVVLDIAIVNVALPSIQVDLAFSQENLQWVISA